MRPTFLSFFWLFCLTGSAQSWSWATRMDYNGTESLVSLAGCDSLKNIYLTIKIAQYGHNAQPPNWKFIKFDVNGKLVWQKDVAGLCRTDQAGITYLVGGNTISKFDSNGNELWHSYQAIAGSYQEISLFSEGGLVAAGNEFSGDTTRSFLKRFDENGNCLWTVIDVRGKLNRPLTTDRQGNIYVYSGGLQIPGEVNSGHLLKYSSGGNLIYDRIVPHFPGSIVVDEQENIYLTGEFSSDMPVQIAKEVIGGSESKCAFLVKYNKEGSVEWYKVFYGSFGSHCLQVDRSGQVYFSISYSAISTNELALENLQNDINGGSWILLKYSPGGSLLTYLKSEPLYEPKSWGPYTSNVKFTLSEDQRQVFCSGTLVGAQNFGKYALYSPGYGDLFIANANLDNGVKGESLEAVESLSIHIYPNPTANLATVDIQTSPDTDYSYRVVDVHGRVILAVASRQSMGRVQEQIDLTPYPSGVYLIEIKVGGRSHYRKLVVR